MYRAVIPTSRTWGTSRDGDVQMLVGTYNLDSEVSRRLLRALPPQIHLRAADWDSPLVELLATEVSRERPGQEVILDRTLDLLLMTAVRAWFDRPETHPKQPIAFWSSTAGPATVTIMNKANRNLRVMHTEATVGVNVFEQVLAEFEHPGKLPVGATAAQLL